MLGTIYTHYALHDKLDRMAPAIIFSLLVITRLIIYRLGQNSNSNIRNETSTEWKKEIDDEVVVQTDDEQETSNEKKEN